ncbi:hypothetical protein HDV02_005878, partial [Globomyces sp. JEL0801]
FVEIGNTIHKIQERQVCIGRAKDGLKFAELLRHSGFLYQCKERYEIYETLIVKIAEYLDGNAKVIQANVKDYFLFQHGKAGLDQSLFDITFSPKKSGIQTGFTYSSIWTNRRQCEKHQTTRYKGAICLQAFESYRNWSSNSFHYTISQHKEDYLHRHQGLSFGLVVQLDQGYNNNALLQLDLISRILCLRDCTTNSSNCGQVGETAMIVDFRIEKQSRGYVKADILDKFFEGISEFHYSGLMATAIKVPYAVKLDVMKKSLQEWKLLESIEWAESEINGLVKRYGGKMRFEDDLQQYVTDLMTTLKVLLKP